MKKRLPRSTKVTYIGRNPEYAGLTMSLGNWSRELGVDYMTVWRRARLGFPIDEIIDWKVCKQEYAAMKVCLLAQAWLQSQAEVQRRYA